MISPLDSSLTHLHQLRKNYDASCTTVLICQIPGKRIGPTVPDEPGKCTCTNIGATGVTGDYGGACGVCSGVNGEYGSDLVQSLPLNPPDDSPGNNAFEHAFSLFHAGLLTEGVEGER